MANEPLICAGPGPHDPPGGILGAWDPTSARRAPDMRCDAPGCQPAPDPAVIVEDALRDRARAALTTNATFLALGTPTAAQNAAQVRALTRQTNALARLLLGLLDDTTGT
jgi:hypothetical protein